VGLARLVPMLCAIWAAPACASLGGDAVEIGADQQAVHASLSVKATALYNVQELSTESGMRIREYVNARGKIFAVAWSGPIPPDLRQLLGPYYAEYTSALLKLQPLGVHRALRISTPTLAVELDGHMRAHSGRAYLPLLIPAGVPMAELR
jgi:hypothetical protein